MVLSQLSIIQRNKEFFIILHANFKMITYAPNATSFFSRENRVD